MNKFILKITLVPNEDCTLIIDIVYWDHRFISNYLMENGIPNFCYFQDSQDFTLYSQHSGHIYGDCLEIPESKYMFNQFGIFIGAQLKYDFLNDDRRFLYLKGLYRCLSEWSVQWEKFKDDVDHTNKIILNSNYWIK